MAYNPENVVRVSPTPRNWHLDFSVITGFCQREEKVTANKIALRSLCPVLALQFQKIDKSSKLQPTATRYWKTSFPNAEPRFSPISKRGLQRVGVVFLLLFAVESINQLLASLYTLHLSVTSLFYTCVVTKQAKETFTSKGKIFW